MPARVDPGDRLQHGTGGGTADPANHAYDLNDFYAAVKAGNYPAVSYIKIAAFQDAHPGNSDPLDEQTGVVTLINFLQQQPDWKNTAVIITYDDSDGWYDHAMPRPQARPRSPRPIVERPRHVRHRGATARRCQRSACDGSLRSRHAHPVHGDLALTPSRTMSATSISQASVVRFIEDNWLQGERLGGGSFDASAGSIVDMFDFNRAATTELILDPTLGTVDTKKSPRTTELSQCYIAQPCGSSAPAFWPAPFSLPSRKRLPGENPNPIHLIRRPVEPLSAMAKLGREIFFDTSLSSSGKMACASCHSPDHAYGPPNDGPVMLGGPTLTLPVCAPSPR